jgi:hypothetical protein
LGNLRKFNDINKIAENIFALNINENENNENEESIDSEFSIDSVDSIQDTNNSESEEGLEKSAGAGIHYVEIFNDI